MWPMNQRISIVCRINNLRVLWKVVHIVDTISGLATFISMENHISSRAYAISGWPLFKFLSLFYSISLLIKSGVVQRLTLDSEKFIVRFHNQFSLHIWSCTVPGKRGVWMVEKTFVSQWELYTTFKPMHLTLNGSHDVDDVIYVDVLLPIERHPMELLRRPEVRSCGTGSILLSRILFFFSLSLFLLGELRCLLVRWSADYWY